MNFSQCANCKLTLPRHRLLPVIVTIKGRQQRILICDYCKQKLEAKFKKGE